MTERDDKWFDTQKAHAARCIAQCDETPTDAQVSAAAEHLERFGEAWLRSAGLLDDAPVQLNIGEVA